MLRGAKGTGKGTLANAFCRLFGDHSMAISNHLHLTGRFNAHLKETVLLFVDEGFWGEEKKGEGVLKQLITEPVIPIERKGYDVERAKNCLHVIVASNESWVVPAHGLERRFCVLDVSDARAGDTKYFGAIWNQLENGGYEAMLNDLLKYDLSRFDVRTAPATTALQEQKLHSLSSFEAWWFGRLQDGQLLHSRAGWNRVVWEDLYTDYISEAGEQAVLNLQRFMTELRKLLRPSQLERERIREDGKRVWVCVFPSLKRCREAWEGHHGVHPNWPLDTQRQVEKEAA